MRWSAAELLSRLKSGAMLLVDLLADLLADRGYDADWIGALVTEHGAGASIHFARSASPIGRSLNRFRIIVCLLLARLDLFSHDTDLIDSRAFRHIDDLDDVPI